MLEACQLKEKVTSTQHHCSPKSPKPSFILSLVFLSYSKRFASVLLSIGYLVIKVFLQHAKQKYEGT